MKVISWHPVLTDHQSYTLAALQETANCILKVYVTKLEHVERQAQGWVNQHAFSMSPGLLPEKGWFKFALGLLREHRDAVHFFGSPFEQARLIVVLLLAVALGAHVYLISEPYSPISTGYQNDKQKLVNWLKAKLRPLIYKIYGILICRRIQGVFAISCLAVHQYQRIGVAREKIFPFGYFVPVQKSVGSVRITKQGKTDFKIVFIGNLIARKGPDVLIAAVKGLHDKGLSLSLDVYGSGDPGQYNFDHSFINYCGLIPFGDAQMVISNYDVLVLPSRYDGWGVVVNEALMAGVPVICSHQVGACAVIAKWQCGDIFASEDEFDLADKLRSLIIYPERLKEMRLSASKAGASLDPQIAGRYMFDVISQHSISDRNQIKPECPWYDCP